MTLEEIVEQLRDAQTVAAAQTLRHETRLKEHQQWLEHMEMAFTRMAKAHEEHDTKMLEVDGKITQLAAAQLLTEEKLYGLIDALKRGSNGHS